MTPLLILVVSILCASAVWAMTEAAILSLPVLRARILLEERRRGAKDLVFIKENIHLTIAVIVMISNAINIVGSFYVGRKVAILFGDKWLGLASGLMTLAVIIFGEIFPKALGERYKTAIALSIAKPLRFVVLIFGPVAKFILNTGGFIKEYSSPKTTEEEIRMMLKLGRDEGTVEMDEEVLCNRVFKLNDLKVSQVMRPIEQIFALPGDKSIGEIKDLIIDSRFSRIAVYDKEITNIVGVVEHRLLLRHIAREHFQALVREFMSPPIFVHHATKADALLEKFLAYNQHLFIVQDDAKKSIGLVTMEDVLEELFGEIYDEKDVKMRGVPPPGTNK